MNDNSYKRSRKYSVSREIESFDCGVFSDLHIFCLFILLHFKEMGRVWTASTGSVLGPWVDCLLHKSEPLNSMKGREICIAYIRALYSEFCCVPLKETCYF